jgi:hypothetical protein
MKFKIKRVILHENKELDIYIPLKVPKQLTAIDPIVWDKAILGNSIAYEFLKKIFILASSLHSHEIIYIPTYPLRSNEYRDIWEYGIFDMGIILVNYHVTQLKAKELYTAIKMKHKFTENIREVFIEDNNISYPHYWLTDKKLSTRRFKDILIISANGDVFLKFAGDTDHMLGRKDDEQYNFDYHLHEDLMGTSKDNGFNFLYYHSKQNL